MTYQARDTLILEKGIFPLEAGIFEPYFVKNPKKRPKSNVLMSSLHRRYCADLEIRKSELLVSKIKVPVSNPLNKLNEDRFRNKVKNISKTIFKEVDLSTIFDDEERQKLYFFSGFIILYHFKHPLYSAANWQTFPLELQTIEQPYKYEILQFVKGKLVAEKELNKTEIARFKNRQFEKFKKSDSYTEMLAEKLSWHKNNEYADGEFDKEKFDSMIFNYLLKYINSFS